MTRRYVSEGVIRGSNNSERTVLGSPEAKRTHKEEEVEGGFPLTSLLRKKRDPNGIVDGKILGLECFVSPSQGLLILGNGQL
jgi:hypothetical protein